MTLKEQSRREFFSTSGSMFGGTWLAINLPAILAAANFACQAQNDGAEFEVLTSSEAVELEAIAAQIIPSDGTPGAREAGVIYFIDRALGTFSSDSAEEVKNGLKEFQETIREKRPDAGAFSKLTSEQQIDALKEIEESDFFNAVRTLTLSGMFSMPSYGGNREKIGWNILQFDDRRTWRPPFGYYDQQYMQEEGRDGE